MSAEEAPTSEELYPSSPPFYQFNDQNHGGLVVVVTYTFLTIAIATLVAQFYIKIVYKKSNFNSSDAFLIAAIIILIPQTILVQQAVDAGLGQRQDTLSVSMIERFEKFTYAHQLLGVFVQVSAKLSVVILTARIDNVSQFVQRWIYVVAAGVAAWTLLAMFGVAFQCSPPRPWEFSPARCGARDIWYAIVAFNIITDLIASVIIVPVIMKLRMRINVRLSVSALFLSRLIVCFVAATSLGFLSRWLLSPDQTWHSVLFVLLNQIVISLSPITAALPSLHKFLVELQTGHLGAHLPESYELTEGSSGRYARKGSAKGQGSKQSSKVGSVIGNALKSPVLGSRRGSALPDVNRGASLSESHRDLITE